MRRVLLTTVVAGLMMLPAVASGQEEPGGGKTAPGEKRAVKVDPELEAWIEILVGRIADKNDTVRQSAEQALAALGRRSIPALEKIADGDDAARAVLAKKLMARIRLTGMRARRIARAGRGMMGGPGAPGPRGRGMGPGVGEGPGRPGLQGRPGMRGRMGPGGGQPGAGGRPARGMALARLARHLELTNEQKSRMKEIHEAHREKVRAIVEKAREEDADRGEVRKKLQGLREDLLKEMKGVLTEEQAEKLEKIRAARGKGGLGPRQGRRARRAGGPPGGFGPGPGGPGPGRGRPGGPPEELGPGPGHPGAGRRFP